MKYFATLAIVIALTSCGEDENLIELSIPKNLTASKGEFTSEIKLNWDEVDNSDSYNVYRFDSLLGDYLSYANVVSNNYIDTAIYSNETKIYYKVTSFKSPDLESDFSDAAFGYYKEVKTPVISASKGDYHDEIKISWNGIDIATRYEVYKRDSTQTVYALLGESLAPEFIDQNRYYPYSKVFYKVQAFTDQGEKSNLSNVDYGYQKLISLDRPTSLTVTKGEFGKKIELNWTAIPQVTQYKIFKFNEEASIYEYLGMTSTNSIVDNSDFTPYIPYYYKVQSFNSISEYSSFSDVDYGYTSGSNYDVIVEFGSWGDGNGQFRFAEHINIDSNKNMYVSEPNANRIQKFDQNGNFIEIYYTTYGPRAISFLNNGNVAIARSGDNEIAIYDNNKNLVNKWGYEGSSNGTFKFFKQITHNNKDEIYVSDVLNHRIQKFDVNGNFLLKWGSYSEVPGNGKFNQPWGITEFKNKVYVSSRNVIQVFDINGKYLFEYENPTQCYDITNDGINLYLGCGSYIMKTDEDFKIIEKVGEGQFSTVTSMAVDEQGYIYATSVYDRKIKVLKPNN